MDNKFYRIDISKFDPTNASAEDIRKWLFAIIDAELEKDPDERDYDLIKECSDFEAELPLSDTDIELSESDYVAGLERIKAQTSVTEHKETKILRPKKKTKKSVRIIAILAASLATLILSLSVAASVQGKPVVQYIVDNVKAILGMDDGEKLDEDSITLVKNGEIFTYSSIEEAIKSIHSEMLYPTYLPDGVKMERIVVMDYDDSNSRAICYIANDDKLSITINYNFNLIYPDLEYSTVHAGSIIEFYIIKTIDGGYQAVSINNNTRYSVKYNNYDELINILNGLKEIEK